MLCDSRGNERNWMQPHRSIARGCLMSFKIHVKVSCWQSPKTIVDYFSLLYWLSIPRRIQMHKRTKNGKSCCPILLFQFVWVCLIFPFATFSIVTGFEAMNRKSFYELFNPFFEKLNPTGHCRAVYIFVVAQ